MNSDWLVCLENVNDVTAKLLSGDTQWRSDGGAGCGPHRAALARGGKGAKKNSRENSDCKFHMCLRARKTKRYGQRPVRTSTLLVLVLRQFRFKNLRRKGGKFDPPPRAAKGPATPLVTLVFSEKS